MRNRAEGGRSRGRHRLSAPLSRLAGAAGLVALAAVPAAQAQIVLPQAPQVGSLGSGGSMVHAAQQAQQAGGGGPGGSADPMQSRGDPGALTTKGPPLKMIFEPRISIQADAYTTKGDAPWQGPGEVRVRAGAGFTFRANTAGLRGHADYMVYGTRYKEADANNRLEQALSANLTAELIDQLLYLDAIGSITQVSNSLFGLQTAPSGSANPNDSHESQNFLLRPRLQTRLGDWLDVRANVAANLLRSSGSLMPTEVLATGGGLQLAHRGPVFGAALDASTERNDFKWGRDTRSDRVWGTLYALIDDLDLQLRLLGGRERSDVLEPPLTTHQTWGVGAMWRPSPNTRLDGQYEQRAFGRAYQLSFDHTSGLVYVNLGASRGVQLGQMQEIQSPQQTAYELFMGSVSQVESDPLKRVSIVLRELAARGMDPLSLQRGRPLYSNSTVLASRLQASVGLRGRRSSIVGTVWRSTAERLDKVPDFYGDFALTNHLRTTGMGIQLSHRLTPTESVALNYMLQDNVGVGTSVRYTQQTLNGTLTSLLTTHSTGSIGITRNWSDRQPTVWGDTAVSAKYDLRF